MSLFLFSFYIELNVYAIFLDDYEQVTGQSPVQIVL